MIRAPMIRFWLVLAATLAVAGLTLAHLSALALTLGIAAGLIFFLRAMAAGGSLGNARQFEKKPADINARIGICLAAAGIASAALGHDPPFPLPFQVFYVACLVLASVGALALAWKGTRE